mgnify:CR=1 FL=1
MTDKQKNSALVIGFSFLFLLSYQFSIRKTLHLNKTIKKDRLNFEMQELLDLSPNYLQGHMEPLEMRDIEHCLCEFDKYERVRLGQGRPRAKYKPKPEEANL